MPGSCILTPRRCRCITAGSDGSEVLANTVFGVGESDAGHMGVRIESVQLCLSFHTVFLSTGVAGRYCVRRRSLTMTHIGGFLDAPQR